MKLFSLLLALALLLTITLVCTAPAPDKKCDFNCDLQDYKPVCGTDDSGDTKKFNNMCILKTENCLRSLSYQKTDDSTCP